MKLAVEPLGHYLPQDYVSEIQGLASLSGIDFADIILLNFGYEIAAYVCAQPLHFLLNFILCIDCFMVEANVVLQWTSDSFQMSML